MFPLIPVESIKSATILLKSNIARVQLSMTGLTSNPRIHSLTSKRIRKSQGSDTSITSATEGTAMALHTPAAPSPGQNDYENLFMQNKNKKRIYPATREA